MAAIGSHTVLTLLGPYQPPRDSYKDITRDGVHGSAYRKNGKRGRIYQMRSAIDIVSNSGAGITTEENTCKALVMTIVSITDTFGRTISNQAILDVEITAVHKLAARAGGITSNSDTIVEMVWTLQDPQTS